MQHRPAIVRWVGSIVGLALIAAGVTLLIIPGPGIPVLVLGLAFLGSQSKLLARGLDRAELALRPHAEAAGRWMRRTKRRVLERARHAWRATSH